jgi:hypothetical protein
MSNTYFQFFIKLFSFNFVYDNEQWKFNNYKDYTYYIDILNIRFIYKNILFIRSLFKIGIINNRFIFHLFFIRIK